MKYSTVKWDKRNLLRILKGGNIQVILNDTWGDQNVTDDRLDINRVRSICKTFFTAKLMKEETSTYSTSFLPQNLWVHRAIEEIISLAKNTLAVLK